MSNRQIIKRIEDELVSLGMQITYLREELRFAEAEEIEKMRLLSQLRKLEDDKNQSF